MWQKYPISEGSNLSEFKNRGPKAFESVSEVEEGVHCVVPVWFRWLPCRNFRRRLRPWTLVKLTALGNFSHIRQKNIQKNIGTQKNIPYIVGGGSQIHERK